jgi:hercynylcysteine S-oxide lyase
MVCYVFITMHVEVLCLGSYGSLPIPVKAACDRWASQIEVNPDLFFRRRYQPLLVSVRERLAELIGANTDECVMVPNTSHGLNTVLRNFEWHHGDIIIGGA